MHEAHPVLFVFAQKTDKFWFAVNGMRTVREWRSAGSQSRLHIPAFGLRTIGCARVYEAVGCLYRPAFFPSRSGMPGLLELDNAGLTLLVDGRRTCNPATLSLANIMNTVVQYWLIIELLTTKIRKLSPDFLIFLKILFMWTNLLRFQGGQGGIWGPSDCLLVWYTEEVALWFWSGLRTCAFLVVSKDSFLQVAGYCVWVGMSCFTQGEFLIRMIVAWDSGTSLLVCVAMWVLGPYQPS